MTLGWPKLQLTAVVICLLAALLAVGALSSRPLLFDPHWPLKWIEVQGVFERVSAEQIRATTAPLLSAGFFGVDLARVRSTIEALPWVRIAEARKRWPDLIQIRIVEHEPTARWGDDQLLSKFGEIFIPHSGVRIEGLPLLQGPDDAATEMIEFYAALQDRLLGTGLDVRELYLSDRGAWRAELTGDLEIELGRHQPLVRLSRLLGALDELMLDDRQLARVDLRYPNGFAVNWRTVEPATVLANNLGGRVSGNPQ